MPWFHQKTDEEKQQEAEAQRHRAQEQADQEASRRAIEQGGLPMQAQRRMQDLHQRADRFFTSDLTVDEFALTRQAGFRPIAQVMGSSVYHVGWQYMPGSWWSRSQELTIISEAFNRARALALGRLQQEAALLGADAVIGVHVERGQYDWGEDLVEFSTVGTAVRLKDVQSTEHPGLTNLSGQDFWKLYRSGYWPLGVVGASSVYYVVASWQTQMANNSFWSSWANQELRDFTQGLYTARHLVMRHIRQQYATQGAEGIIGMQIEEESEEREVEINDNTSRTDMIFTFHALGTAVAPLAGYPRAGDGAPPSVAAVLNIGKRADQDSGRMA